MALMHARLNTVLLVVLVCIGVAVLAVLATRAQGGPLDPPGAPASTQRPLRELNGAWSRTFPANDGTSCNSSRFVCVLGDQGVLDNETNLVWARQPWAFFTGGWDLAMAQCPDAGLGNRLGWRVPSIEELASIVDFNEENPALPAGHPFLNVGTGYYWSSTTMPGAPGQAYAIDLVSEFGYALSSLDKTTAGQVWCVRGGQSVDAFAP